MTYVLFGLPIEVNYGSLPSTSNQIPVSIILTVINGVTTSTSIIIAFGGVVVGLFFRNLPKKDVRRTIFFVLLLLFAFSFLYLFSAYLLSATGQGNLGFALRNALLAFLLSLLILLEVFVVAVTIIDEEEGTKSKKIESDKPKPDESKTADKNKNGSKDTYKEAIKELVAKAQQKKFFWKGLMLGLFYGIIGNMLVSHYYGVFTGLVALKFDDLFLANLVSFIIILCAILLVSWKVYQSIAKTDDFLKFVEETKKKYHLDDDFNEVKGKSD
jgi:ABC-type multidrug transport system fused ATPase/permease subunit